VLNLAPAASVQNTLQRQLLLLPVLLLLVEGMAC
jgi:hypothetical protein